MVNVALNGSKSTVYFRHVGVLRAGVEATEGDPVGETAETDSLAAKSKDAESIA